MMSKVCITLAIVLLLAAFMSGVEAQELTDKELLGRFLFFDANLSTPSGQSCAACHAPETGFTGPDSSINAAGAVMPGIVPTRFSNRRPPTVAYAGDNPVLYYDETEGIWIGGLLWDGKVTGTAVNDPLVEQAGRPFLHPLEEKNPNEKIVCIKVHKSGYADLFKQVWGPGSLDFVKDVEGTYDRIARSIAAYERSAEVSSFTSKYDYYLNGEVALTDEEAWGLELFNDPGKGNCAACHPSTSGPFSDKILFTDCTYDNIGMPKNPENPFYSMPRKWNPAGENWIDTGLGGFLKTAGYPPEVYEPEWGKFKVPTLRNLDLRPYPGFVKAFGHNGYFKSLEEAVHFYNTRDVEEWPPPEVPVNVNTTEMGDLGLTPAEEAAIVAFLRTLSDGYVPSSVAPPFVPVVRFSLYREAPKFQLFQNTPNPFNPETWIPFSLGATEEVFINIYDMQGQLVKRLCLGTKPAGVHIGSDKAAYWDGTNSYGERVSSGVYYYMMQAGPFGQIKKMVILE